MPSLLIADATVVTVNERDEVLDHGWIAVEDGAVAAVSATPLPAPDGTRVIDGRGLVAMPGLVNAHTHLFQTLIRGVYEELPFADWLRRIYACGTVLTPEDTRLGARLGCLESIRSGVTTVVEHQFLNRGNELSEAAIEGMRDLGVRAVLARTIMDLGDLAPPEVLETPEQGLRAVEALLDRRRGESDDMLTLMTGGNTPGASASAELARDARAFAAERGIMVSEHLAESASVLDAVERRSGVRGIVRWLDQMEALGPNVLAPHSVHVSPEEVRVMADRGVAVSHNPVSNMFLGDGIAPVVEMLRAGVTVGLGTDGAASNNRQDMFEVMKAAALLQRARAQDAHAITSAQALRMATIGGAQAIGLGDRVGSLEVGKRADVVLLDLYGSAHSVAVHDVVSHLVHCANPSNVRTVVVDGRVVLDDGQVVGLDEERFLREAQAGGRDLVRRLGA